MDTRLHCPGKDEKFCTTSSQSYRCLLGWDDILRDPIRRINPSRDVDANKEEIFSFCHQPHCGELKQVILKCFGHESQKRPTMLKVKEKLQDLLCRENPARIAQKVAEVLKSYEGKCHIQSISDFVSMNEVPSF